MGITKILLIILIVLFFFNPNLSFSQNDSLKYFKTDNFDLTYCDSSMFVLGSLNPILTDFINCNRIKLITDSSMMITHIAGSNFILYKDILGINVPTIKNNFGKGLGQGALYGLGAGLLFDLIFNIAYKDNHETPAIGRAVSSVLIPISSVITGSIIGGIAGLFIFDSEYINFSKYPNNSKKEKFLNIILKYKVDF
jgi:hypothetical protein